MHDPGLLCQVLERLALLHLWSVNDLTIASDVEEVNRLTRLLGRIGGLR